MTETTPCSIGRSSFFSKLLLRARHDAQRPCAAMEVPLLIPDTIFISSSQTCTHPPEGSTSFFLFRSCLGTWSYCFNKTHTYFQNKLPSCSSSFVERNLGSKWRQVRNESTKETPSNSSWIRVCHPFIFQILFNPKIPCLYLLCLSTQPISC
jgi:hypothetical protein